MNRIWKRIIITLKPCSSFLPPFSPDQKNFPLDLKGECCSPGLDGLYSSSPKYFFHMVKIVIFVHIWDIFFFSFHHSLRQNFIAKKQWSKLLICIDVTTALSVLEKKKCLVPRLISSFEFIHICMYFTISFEWKKFHIFIPCYNSS